jgi:hypothetical protein
MVFVSQAPTIHYLLYSLFHQLQMPVLGRDREKTNIVVVLPQPCVSKDIQNVNAATTRNIAGKDTYLGFQIISISERVMFDWWHLQCCPPAASLTENRLL